MLISCLIYFDVARDGYISTASVETWLDTADDLAPQAAIEVQEWIARKAKIANQKYQLVAVRDIQYWVNGSIFHNQLEWAPGLRTLTHNSNSTTD